MLLDFLSGFINVYKIKYLLSRGYYGDIKKYKDFILNQLNLLDNVACRAMMGEFLLYNNLLFGGIYDNQLLVKIVDTNTKYNMAKL